MSNLKRLVTQNLNHEQIMVICDNFEELYFIAGYCFNGDFMLTNVDLSPVFNAERNKEYHRATPPTHV